MESNKEKTDHTTNSVNVSTELLSSVLELIEEIHKLKVKILNSQVGKRNRSEAIKDLQNAEMKLIASLHPAKNW